jgi:hypothetical protein
LPGSTGGTAAGGSVSDNRGGADTKAVSAVKNGSADTFEVFVCNSLVSSAVSTIITFVDPPGSDTAAFTSSGERVHQELIVGDQAGGDQDNSTAAPAKTAHSSGSEKRRPFAAAGAGARGSKSRW